VLFSIGYQSLKDPALLIKILQDHQVEFLIDVRSKPFGRNREFNRPQLSKAVRAAGIGYLWKGDSLGGFDEIGQEAIKGLAGWQRDKRACLMCMEADPDRCHRKNEIGRRLAELGVGVEHLTTHVRDLALAGKKRTEPHLFDV